MLRGKGEGGATTAAEGTFESEQAQRNIVNVKCGLASFFLSLSLSHRHLNGLLTIAAAAAATECVHAVPLFILSGS